MKTLRIGKIIMPEQEFVLNGWLVDLAGGQIMRAGRSVHLEPLVVKTLAFLIRNRNQVVSKDDIVEAVWGHNDVSDAALTRCIFEIRRAFGDNARAPKVVETIPKVGYRFVAVLQAPPKTSDSRRSLFKGSIAAIFVAGILITVGIQSGQRESFAQIKSPEVTRNAQAHDAYHKGLSQLDQYTYLSNENAIILFERAVEFDPAFGLAYVGLSQSLARQFRHWNGERLEEARGAARKGLELLPSHAQSHFAYGMVLTLGGEVDKGIDYLLQAHALDPGHWKSAYNAAVLFKQDLQFKRAEELFLEALEYSPLNVKAMSHLGFLYLRMGQIDDARHWLNRAIDHSPLEVGARAQLASLEMVVGNFDKAIQDCLEVREVFPTQRRCLQVLGASHLIDGNFEQAQAWFDYTAATYPDSSYAQLGIAQVLLRNGHVAESMDIINRVSEKAQRDMAASDFPWEEYWLLAACHALKDDRAGAFEWLEKAAKAGRRFHLWDSADPVFATLQGDKRFDHYIAMTHGNNR